MKSILTKIAELEKRLAIDYNEYKKEHPGTQKAPGDPLFNPQSHGTHNVGSHVAVQEHAPSGSPRTPWSGQITNHRAGGLGQGSHEYLVKPHKGTAAPVQAAGKWVPAQSMQPHTSPAAPAQAPVQAPKVKKKPEEMTAGEIKKRYNKLREESSKHTDDMINAGFGNLRPSDIRDKMRAGDNHPLFKKHVELSDEMGSLMNEAKARYGPDLASIDHLKSGPINLKKYR